MKRLPIILFVTMIFALAACQTQQVPTSTPDFAATARIRVSWTAIPVVEAVTATPTPTATSSNTPTDVPPTNTPTPLPPTETQTSTPTFTPSTTYTPTITPTPTITYTPSLAVTQIDTQVPGPLGGGDFVTWTPEPALRDLAEHFVFQRPIGAGGTNYWARNYSYGSTDGGSRPVHHGLDLQNETGTPVLAAADGTVYYAGNDTDKLFGPQPDFYGNVVVIKHNFQYSDGTPIFTLYGHLSETVAVTGDLVKAGDVIGRVGSAGVALGPHLHFEVRIGEPTSYNATINPELWIMPFLDYGVLAARVMDLKGNLIPGVKVQAQSPSLYMDAYSYADNSVHGDPEYQENLVIPELQEGYYRVTVKVDEITRFRTTVFIKHNRLSWLNIYLDLPPTPMPTP